MQSANPQVMELFRAYCEAKNLEGLEMNQYFERKIAEAMVMGLRPEDVTAVIRARQRAIREGSRRHESVLFRNIFGDESSGDVLDEAADLRSKQRIRPMDAARRSILMQTGREEKAAETPAKQAGETELISVLRKAAQ